MSRRTRNQNGGALPLDNPGGDTMKQFNDSFDPATIEAQAQELDAAAGAPGAQLTEDQPPAPAPGSKPKRKRRTRAQMEAARGGGRSAEVNAPLEDGALPYDPEFEIMLVTMVGTGVEIVKAKRGWSDPGEEWRMKVGACLSRLLQRIKPMKPGPVSDIITIVGYSAMWAVPELMNGRTSQSQAMPGDNGERQNLSNEGITG